MSRSLSGIYLPATSGAVPIGDGTQWNSVSLSGDVFVDSTGATTIQPGVVTNADLAPLTQGSIKIGNATNQVSDLPIGTAGQVFLSDGTTGNWTTLSGGITSVSSTGVVTLTPTPVPLVFSNQTSNYSILPTDNNTIFTNTGATTPITLTLPLAPTQGFTYEFWATAPQTIVVTTGNTGTESIVTNDSGSSASGYTIQFTGTGTSQYAVLRLVALSSTAWIITQNIGSWSLSSP